MTLSVTCQQCGKKFEAKRKTAQYCSTKCRVEASRVTEKVTDSTGKEYVADIPVTKISVPEHIASMLATEVVEEHSVNDLVWFYDETWFPKTGVVQLDTSPKWKKVIQSLIDRREKIINAGLSGEAQFFLGKTSIVLTIDSISIGSKRWNLGKP